MPNELKSIVLCISMDEEKFGDCFARIEFHETLTIHKC